MQRITTFLLVSIFFLTLFSCSKDDSENDPDNEPSVVELSLIDDQAEITVPTAMMTSQDPYAAQAVGYVNSAKGFSSYLSNFQPPAGAVKSTTPISVSDGRIAETSPSSGYLVYYWTYSGTTIAYQISQTSSKYVFEVFYKTSEDAEFVKYLYAEQSKTVNEGYMDVYDIFGLSDEEGSVLFKYVWAQDENDVYTLTMTSFGDLMKYVIVVNPDNSGSVNYYFDDDLSYYMDWDSAGNGSWIYYYDGEVSDQGSWTV